MASRLSPPPSLSSSPTITVCTTVLNTCAWLLITRTLTFYWTAWTPPHGCWCPTWWSLPSHHPYHNYLLLDCLNTSSWLLMSNLVILTITPPIPQLPSGGLPWTPPHGCWCPTWWSLPSHHPYHNYLLEDCPEHLLMVVDVQPGDPYHHTTHTTITFYWTAWTPPHGCWCPTWWSLPSHHPYHNYLLEDCPEHLLMVVDVQPGDPYHHTTHTTITFWRTALNTSSWLLMSNLVILTITPPIPQLPSGGLPWTPPHGCWCPTWWSLPSHHPYHKFLLEDCPEHLLMAVDVQPGDPYHHTTHTTITFWRTALNTSSWMLMSNLVILTITPPIPQLPSGGLPWTPPRGCWCPTWWSLPSHHPYHNYLLEDCPEHLLMAVDVQPGDPYHHTTHTTNSFWRTALNTSSWLLMSNLVILTITPPIPQLPSGGLPWTPPHGCWCPTWWSLPSHHPYHNYLLEDCPEHLLMAVDVQPGDPYHHTTHTTNSFWRTALNTSSWLLMSNLVILTITPPIPQLPSGGLPWTPPHGCWCPTWWSLPSHHPYHNYLLEDCTEHLLMAVDVQPGDPYHHTTHTTITFWRTALNTSSWLLMSSRSAIRLSSWSSSTWRSSSNTSHWMASSSSSSSCRLWIKSSNCRPEGFEITVCLDIWCCCCFLSLQCELPLLCRTSATSGGLDGYYQR